MFGGRRNNQKWCHFVGSDEWGPLLFPLEGELLEEKHSKALSSPAVYSVPSDSILDSGSRAMKPHPALLSCWARV